MQKYLDTVNHSLDLLFGLVAMHYVNGVYAWFAGGDMTAAYYGYGLAAFGVAFNAVRAGVSFSYVSQITTLASGAGSLISMGLQKLGVR